jgi:hypothetical protein
VDRLCVVVRVHQRMRDLEILCSVIARHWTLPRHVLVVSNGAAAGHRVPGGVHALVDRVVELEHNAGHIGGNSQLLQAALPLVPADCPYTLLLEADSWLFGDHLLQVYIEKLEATGAAWASAHWQDRWHSQALDLALVRTAALRAHPELLEYTRHAECSVANRLDALGLGRLPITELMPVHIPALLRRFWNRWGGRFRCFPEGPLVTHHGEDLPDGMEGKRAEANRTLGRAEFDDLPAEDWARARARIRRIRALARWIPRSAWLKRKRHRGL